MATNEIGLTYQQQRLERERTTIDHDTQIALLRGTPLGAAQRLVVDRAAQISDASVEPAVANSSLETLTYRQQIREQEKAGRDHQTMVDAQRGTLSAAQTYLPERRRTGRIGE